MQDVRVWIIALAIFGSALGLFASVTVGIVASAVAVLVAGYFVVISFRSEYRTDAVGFNIFVLSVGCLALFLILMWLGIWLGR